jgi:Domain of unknown function (DUF4386)
MRFLSRFVRERHKTFQRRLPYLRLRFSPVRIHDLDQEPKPIRGLLYALISIPGAFALIHVPSKLIAHGNATATAGNIAAHETLFRVGIACNLTCQILFMWVALALYDLLQGINQRRASLIVWTICGVGSDRAFE